MAVFISVGLKKKFTIKKFNLHPRTYSKYVKVLAKNGLLIILSKKPLTCIIPYNSFLRDLVSYFGYEVIIPHQQEGLFYSEIKRELERFKRLRKTNVREYQKIINNCQEFCVV